ncbi:hypothetical protein EDM58_17420 [Brevibacillus panacihumi]|uniref:Uncharacterized protein n=1 Tax=Brevibacillus panacihumi TaxID=497735 RepID=A0A3M8CLR8_9BACL|nr:hypothetical protein EDM58_17420 [Brevibacillus panacihumi]
MEKTTLEFGVVFPFLRNKQKKTGDQKKLVEEKGEKSEGIWDLDQAGTEKAEHAFSGQRAQQAVNC